MTIVSDICVKKNHLVTAKPSSTIGDALKAMNGARAGSILIMDADGKKAIGIATKRDFLKGMEQGIGLDKPLSEIASKKELVTIDGDSHRDVALKMIMDLKVHHLVVVHPKDKHLVGILTTTDIVKAAALEAKLLPWTRDDFARSKPTVSVPGSSSSSKRSTSSKGSKKGKK